MGRAEGHPLSGRKAEERILQDKLRGTLVGLLAGEALGAPVAGISRDAILRRHGRVVRLLEERPLLPLSARAREVLSGASGRPADDREWLALAVVLPVLAAAGARTQADGGPGAPHRSPTGLRAEDPVPARCGDLALAAAILRDLAPIALAAHPYRRLPERALIEAVGAHDPAGARLLHDHALSPPAPGVCAAAFAGAPPLLAEVLTAVQALLVRPRSTEEAVVHAVNLGGDAPLRGALTGALAGAHRGASGVPERWTLPLPGRGLMEDLARVLIIDVLPSSPLEPEEPR